MVGHLIGPDAGRFFSSLERDEDRLILTAAIALHNGVADPLGFLERAGDDWSIGLAVLNRAQEMAVKRREAELRFLVDGIGKRVGDVVATALRKAFS